jgi:phosphoglucosamine mutase
MKLFGTDGIRGKVNARRMNPETVLKVGLALGKVLRKKHGRNMVLIGKDTRLSGYLIESALTSGICSMGMDVTLVGPIPTPGVAFLTRALRVDAGIVISASHNPFEDNGIKIFSQDGFKLPDEVEERIEELVQGEGIFKNRPHGEEIGKAHRLEDANGRYMEHVKSTVPEGFTLDGLKVVVDCANGAAYKLTPHLLEELGAEVVPINIEPDGININRDCGSLHMDRLSKEIKRHGADAGVAHDGDADRTLFCDEKGSIIDGDQVMGACAVWMKEEGRLTGDTVVATVMSNLGLENYLKGKGIKLLRTKVGDRFVTDEMRKGGYNFGGEQSGHIIFFDYNTTGDGPLTALQVLHLMKTTGRSLSSLAGEIERYPQVLINVPVKMRRGWSSHTEIQNEIERAEQKMGDTGRVLVRPSGTEKIIRVMLEGEDGALVKRLARKIADTVKAKMS